MTEEEWQTSDDPVFVMMSLKGKTSTRKANLFDLACARSLSRFWTIPAFESRIAMNERRIEGLKVDEHEYERIGDLVSQAVSEAYQLAHEDLGDRGDLDSRHEHLILSSEALGLAYAACESLAWWEWMEPHELRFYVPTANSEQLRMNIRVGIYRDHLPQLRDIFGNPFRPISFLPEWRTTTAVAIAQSMYESRDFGPMPLLADALQDSGCEVPEIIDHCRGPGPHVRGCWVVDGVLGKA